MSFFGTGARSVPPSGQLDQARLGEAAMELEAAGNLVSPQPPKPSAGVGGPGEVSDAMQFPDVLAALRRRVSHPAG